MSYDYQDGGWQQDGSWTADLELVGMTMSREELWEWLKDGLTGVLIGVIVFIMGCRILHKMVNKNTIIQEERRQERRLMLLGAITLLPMFFLLLWRWGLL